ncbi:MAG: MFS transporter, partial [Endomicrobium sp.]|nr:MFS transporter [Endomicrobium sp.]
IVAKINQIGASFAKNKKITLDDINKLEEIINAIDIVPQDGYDWNIISRDMFRIHLETLRNAVTNQNLKDIGSTLETIVILLVKELTYTGQEGMDLLLPDNDNSIKQSVDLNNLYIASAFSRLAISVGDYTASSQTEMIDLEIMHSSRSILLFILTKAYYSLPEGSNLEKEVARVSLEDLKEEDLRIYNSLLGRSTEENFSPRVTSSGYESASSRYQAFSLQPLQIEVTNKAEEEAFLQLLNNNVAVNLENNQNMFSEVVKMSRQLVVQEALPLVQVQQPLFAKPVSNANEAKAAEGTKEQTPTRVSGQGSVQQEIDGSVDSIEEVLNNSLVNMRIQDGVFDDLIGELEETLDSVKNRGAVDDEKKEQTTQAGELFRADIENLLNIITKLKADKNFTRGQKLSIARVIARSWGLAIVNDVVRTARLADPSDPRAVSASMLQNGLRDKDVLDALNNFFAEESNLKVSQIKDLAFHANEAVVESEEYKYFRTVVESEEYYAQEENSDRFGPNEVDIKEIAKQIQMLHLLQPDLKITADVLRELGVAKGLDTILAGAMSKVRFSTTSVGAPKFSATFETQAMENMSELLSNLTNSGYADAIVIAKAIETLGLSAQVLQDIIGSMQVLTDSEMFKELKNRLLKEIDKKVYESLSNKENVYRVLNGALPTFVVRNKINSIVEKVNSSGQITKEEINYLESIKDTSFYQGELLVEAIQSNLEKGVDLPIDFVEKVLNRNDFDRLLNHFVTVRTKVVEEPTKLGSREEKAYKDKLRILDKAIASIGTKEVLEEMFKGDHQYFMVIKYANNKDELVRILQDEEVEIKIRLYAYGYLKVMGESDFDSYVQSNAVSEKIKTMLQEKKLQLNNDYFDLRASQLAINIVVSRGVLDKVPKISASELLEYNKQNNKTYGLIMNSILVKKELVFNADDGLAFVKMSKAYKWFQGLKGLDEHDAFYQMMAHELGHKQFQAIGIEGYSMSSGMFHEFFADTVAGFFTSTFLGERVNKFFSSLLYLWFRAIKSFAVFSSKTGQKEQKEHSSARGLMGTIRSTLQEMGKEISFDIIMKASIQVVSGTEEKYLLGELEQSELAKRVVLAVAAAVAEEDNTFSRGEFIYRFMVDEGVSFDSLEEAKAIFRDKDGILNEKELVIYLMAKHSDAGFFQRRSELYKQEAEYIDNYLNTRPGVKDAYQKDKNLEMKARVVPTSISVVKTIFYAIGVISVGVAVVGLLAFGWSMLLALQVVLITAIVMGSLMILANLLMMVVGIKGGISVLTKGAVTWVIAGSLVVITASVLLGFLSAITGMIMVAWVIIGVVALASLVGFVVAAYRWYKSSKAESKRTELEELALKEMQKVPNIISSLSNDGKLSQDDIDFMAGLVNKDNYLGSGIVEVFKANTEKFLGSKEFFSLAAKILNQEDLKKVAESLSEYKKDIVSKEPFYNEDNLHEAYKTKVSNIDKSVAYLATPEMLDEMFPEDAGYLKIIKVSDEPTALLNILQDRNTEITHKLYVFAIMKSKGIVEIDGLNIDDYIKSLSTDIINMLKDKKLKLSASYFDLRVCIIAINVLASSKVIEEVQGAGLNADNIVAGENNQYSMVLNANFFKRGIRQRFNADSGMNFMRFKTRDRGYAGEHKFFYEVIAHELGHTYLFALDNYKYRYTSNAEQMLHELTADLVSSVFNSVFLQTNILKGNIIKKNKKEFSVFSTSEEQQQTQEIEEKAQEGHGAARGLLKTFKKVLKKMNIVGTERIAKPLLRASLIVAMTLSPAMFGVGQQSLVAREIVFSMANTMEQAEPTFNRGEFLYNFIDTEGIAFSSFAKEKEMFKNEQDLTAYLVAKNAKRFSKDVKFPEEKEFLKQKGFSYESEKQGLIEKLSREGTLSETEVSTLEQMKNTDEYKTLSFEQIFTEAKNFEISENLANIMTRVLRAEDLKQVAQYFINERDNFLSKTAVNDASALSYYKINLANLNKDIAYFASSEQLQSSFGRDAKFFELIKNANNQQYLLNVMQDANQETRVRLYAFAQLKAKGIDSVTIDGVNIDVDEIAKSLLPKINEMLKQSINPASVEDSTSFDLQSVSIGLNLAVDSAMESSSSYTNKSKKQKIYSEILDSIFINSKNIALKNNDLLFDHSYSDYNKASSLSRYRRNLFKNLSLDYFKEMPYSDCVKVMENYPSVIGSIVDSDMASFSGPYQKEAEKIMNSKKELTKSEETATTETTTTEVTQGTSQEKIQTTTTTEETSMQESVASARFTSIRAGILAFFNTGGFIALTVLLSLAVITG